MSNKEATLISTEKIKSFAIAIIGAGIFSTGTTYFAEQSSYRVPRILFPIFEYFGNIGLAVGMIIMGVLLLYYSYRKFTKHKGKPFIIIAGQIMMIISFYLIISYDQSKKEPSIDRLKEKLEQNTAGNSTITRPTLDSESANTYLNKLENLKVKFGQAVNQNNKVKFDECEKEYTSILLESGDIIKDLASKPEYPAFAKYDATIFDQIQVFRVHKW